MNLDFLATSNVRVLGALFGRIVFTTSKGLPGVCFTRPEWNTIKDKQYGTAKRQNRDTHYATVWARLDDDSPFQKTTVHHDD